MAFELNQIVPWGRSMEEYRRMFSLNAAHAHMKILGCGDGPASFNSEATQKGWNIVSVDPLYHYSSKAIQARIEQTKEVVMKQTREHQHQFLWNLFANPDELCAARLAAMHLFLEDFETGKTTGRYITGSLPNLTLDTQSFDLALVSHLLFLYTAQMSLEVHLQSITELLRVSNEVRIFPLLDLTVTKSSHLEKVIELFSKNFDVRVEKVDYEFQVGGNEMLMIRHR
jgi:hypothetical protein